MFFLKLRYHFTAILLQSGFSLERKMKLNEIFTLRGYDIVVAVKVAAINEQLKKLSESGIIKST